MCTQFPEGREVLAPSSSDADALDLESEPFRLAPARREGTDRAL